MIEFRHKTNTCHMILLYYIYKRSTLFYANGRKSVVCIWVGTDQEEVMAPVGMSFSIHIYISMSI